MNKLPIGRTLDSAGKPIDSTGILMDPDSKTYQLLLDPASSYLMTNPITGEIVLEATITNAAGEQVRKGIGIMPPGASGPSEHIHPTYEEEFEVLEGQATFHLNGEPRVLQAGEKVIVPPQTPHTFQPHGDSVMTVAVEARPPGRLGEVVSTVFAFAHEGKTGKGGEPSFWQGIAMGADMKDDTIFTTAPIGVQKVLFALLGPIATALGYRSTHEEYMTEAYWRKKVEQPQ